MNNIYKNRKFGPVRIVFAYGEGLNGEKGGDLTFYVGGTMVSLIFPRFWNSYVFRGST